MQNLKIRVNNEQESKEAQELLSGLGYVKDNWLWSGLNEYPIELKTRDGGYSDFKLNSEDAIERQEITLLELRAMVNPVKEYLTKNNHGNYELVYQKWRNDDIEIPEGSNYAYDNDLGLLFMPSEIGINHPSLVWQRATHPEELPFIDDEPKYTDDEVKYMDENGQGRLQSLNDQYAEIEQVRQVEIHGTVKVEPDFNFGAAQANSGANMRENNHYFINVSDVDEVDFYEIAKRYNVTDPAIQHILKKCLAIGNRGHKDLETDLKDILKTAKRALQINGFGE